MNSLTRTVLGAGVAMALFTAIAGAQSSAIPRTPWGDPDIQGTYTNSSESGITMERPAEFAGRRLEDVKPEELAKLKSSPEIYITHLKPREADLIMDEIGSRVAERRHCRCRAGSSP